MQAQGPNGQHYCKQRQSTGLRQHCTLGMPTVREYAVLILIFHWNWRNIQWQNSGWLFKMCTNIFCSDHLSAVLFFFEYQCSARSMWITSCTVINGRCFRHCCGSEGVTESRKYHTGLCVLWIISHNTTLITVVFLYYGVLPQAVAKNTQQYAKIILVNI